MTRRDASRHAERKLTVVAGAAGAEKDAPAKHEMTQAERAVIEKLAAKVAAGPKGPPMTLTVKDDGVVSIGYQHPDPTIGCCLVMAAVGTASGEFYDGLLRQIAGLGSHSNRIDEKASNFVLSVVQAVKPQDELEAMLAAQMGAVHAATMMMARRLNHVETIPQQDAAERALNKLARTYATQIETLKRYRTGGQQTVTVEHVTVNEGGQAIVGNVAHRGGRGDSENER